MSAGNVKCVGAGLCKINEILHRDFGDVMKKRLESVSANLSAGTSVGFGMKTSEEKEKRERSVRISHVVSFWFLSFECYRIVIICSHWDGVVAIFRGLLEWPEYGFRIRYPISGRNHQWSCLHSKLLHPHWNRRGQIQLGRAAKAFPENGGNQQGKYITHRFIYYYFLSSYFSIISNHSSRFFFLILEWFGAAL